MILSIGGGDFTIFIWKEKQENLISPNETRRKKDYCVSSPTRNPCGPNTVMVYT